MNEMRITIVDDEPCPECGQAGRPKVGDEQGRWWWKCSTEGCSVGYYLPETGETERRPSPAELAEIQARSAQRVKDQLAGRTWVSRSSGAMIEAKAVPDSEVARYLADGWNELGKSGEEQDR